MTALLGLVVTTIGGFIAWGGASGNMANMLAALIDPKSVGAGAGGGGGSNAPTASEKQTLAVVAPISTFSPIPSLLKKLGL